MKTDEIKEIMKCARALSSSLAVPVMLDHGEALRLIVSDLTAKYHHNAERNDAEWTPIFAKVLSYYLSTAELEALTSPANDKAQAPGRNKSMETKQTTPAQPGTGPLSAPPCSAILSMPPETRSAVMSVIYRPQFLARVLREEAKSAEGWANVHADRQSYTKDDSGNWITKHDAYAARAKMLRAAVDVFDPPNDIALAQQARSSEASCSGDIYSPGRVIFRGKICTLEKRRLLHSVPKLRSRVFWCICLGGKIVNDFTQQNKKSDVMIYFQSIDNAFSAAHREGWLTLPNDKVLAPKGPQ